MLNLVKEVTYTERVVRAVLSGCLGCWLLSSPSHTLVYYFEVVFAEFERRENLKKKKAASVSLFYFYNPLQFGVKKKGKKTGRKKNKEMRCGKRS